MLSHPFLHFIWCRANSDDRAPADGYRGAFLHIWNQSGSTEEFIPCAHKRSPLPTKQGSHPFKSCSKRAKAAPSITMSKEGGGKK